MPLYEYQCSACAHRFESLQKVTAAPLSICPSCHQETLRKLVSAPAFSLKGTGWYVTDFKDSRKSSSSAPEMTKIDINEDGKDKDVNKDAKGGKDSNDTNNTDKKDTTKDTKSTAEGVA